ncbi:MAG: enoyl-CoA hydratase-related protein [Carboxydocellales bacterium]
MKYETVKVLVKDGVGVIQLDYPRRKNALSNQLQADLRSALENLATEKEARVLIIQGAKSYFASGGDISQMENFSGPLDAKTYISNIHSLFNSIARHPKVIIAVVAGIAYGGGFEMAMACDLRIVADNVKFGLPEAKLGLMAGAGGTSRLPRLIGASKAKELLFSTEPLDAAEAYRLGLANRVVPLDQLEETAFEFAKKIASLPQLAIRMAKLSTDNCLDMDSKTASEFEMQCIVNLFQTSDAHEGIRAFMEKRVANFIHE